MFRAGARNLITDVGGLTVGHAEDAAARTGVTALVCESAWPAAVDVRGGGPGLRETEVLAPENLVGRAHALVLAGGSVFGLAAADGVAAALSVAGVGLNLRRGSPAIPIVPAAVLHDLANGGDKGWGMNPPYRELGVAALRAAGADFALGSAGAGCGAMAGLQKGGIGSASLDLGDGITIGALVVVNSVGSVLMPDGRTYWAWPFEIGGEFGGSGPPRTALDVSDPEPAQSRLRDLDALQAGANTTLAVVACNANLTTVQCKRMAMMAQDGIARAIRPAHTPFDGDTVFAIATGAPAGARSAKEGPSLVARIGSAAADCLARAIARAVHFA
jgi:L-aminopeptidase/D-esterase-like protein